MTRKPKQPKRAANKEFKKQRFLEAFAHTATIRQAAKAVGISHEAVYSWRVNDPDFEAKFESVNDHVTWQLEDSAMDRALAGSEVLTIFLLKSRDPNKYTQKYRHEIQMPVIDSIFSELLSLLKQRLPKSCPHCHTLMTLREDLAQDLLALSEKHLNAQEVKPA